MNRELLTVRDAARRIGVSYSTLKQWIYKGAVRTMRTEGGHHRVPAGEVDRLLMASGAPPATEAEKVSHGILVALSGRNQLRGLVDEVREDGLLAQVKLRIGTQRLTAVITRDALDELALRRGDEAVAIIKSTEVMIGRGPAGVPATRSVRGGVEAGVPATRSVRGGAEAPRQTPRRRAKRPQARKSGRKR